MLYRVGRQSKPYNYDILILIPLQEVVFIKLFGVDPFLYRFVYLTGGKANKTATAQDILDLRAITIGGAL
jgi:hypothetical protein